MNIAKHLILMAAIPAMVIAMPASAQPGYGGQQGSYRGGGNAEIDMSARVRQLDMRLQAGIESGTISRREAMPLRRDLRQLTQLERRYSANGTNARERSELQRRIRDVRNGIRRADGNDQARWDSYDREDGYGRNGLWSDSGDGRDPEGQVRWGLGEAVDTMRGGGLRVGQQAAANLDALPASYRDQYRDGDGAYYRSDGRQIYRIDARSRTVLRVHPMNR